MSRDFSTFFALQLTEDELQQLTALSEPEDKENSDHR
jgi:hypothetical protein